MAAGCGGGCVYLHEGVELREGLLAAVGAEGLEVAVGQELEDEDDGLVTLWGRRKKNE